MTGKASKTSRTSRKPRKLTVAQQALAVAEYVDSIRAAAPAGATVATGEGSNDGTCAYRRDGRGFGTGNETWATVLVGAAARVVFNVSCDEQGVDVYGHTLFTNAEGQWCSYSRRGIEDSFYGTDFSNRSNPPKPASELLAKQLERAEAGRAKALANVGKWITVPGAPSRLHQDDLPRVQATLASGSVHSIYPHGFGTGMQISARLIRGWTRNPAVAKALGVREAFTSTFDAD
jgi:hypothetical protein